jgi:FAD-dependent urate hydroxylase
MKIAVVGCGTAGPVAALLLARDGHDVEIFERVAEPRGVGAGILLQRLGQQVLETLDLADELERCSAPVRRVDARTPSGRRVIDFAYEDVVQGTYGWGVARGRLFELLWRAVSAARIPVHTGVVVEALTRDRAGWRIPAAEGDGHGPFDLVVAADGARSRLRRWSGLARKDVGYPYGALWSVVPDPEHLASDVLFQRYRDTRVTLGVLPTGVAQACVFWSIRGRKIPSALAAGAAEMAAAARSVAGPLATLVERVADGTVLGARYRDVVVRSSTLVVGGSGFVLIGDAAHAMSPQLGLGASLAFADAATLSACLRSAPRDLGRALRTYDASRRAHIRYYTWCSRLMTPVFQSDLVPVGWARDVLLEPVARVPWVRRQFVTTLMGIRTSPWTTWRGPGA